MRCPGKALTLLVSVAGIIFHAPSNGSRGAGGHLHAIDTALVDAGRPLARAEAQEFKCGIPRWVPVYPGTFPKPAYCAQTPEGFDGRWEFESRQAATKVLAYFLEGHHRVARRRILAHILTHANLALDKPALRAAIVDDARGDALDSVVAASATFRALRSGMRVPEHDAHDYRLEGMVYD